MNAKLIPTCACLWLLGLFGMSLSRGLFDLGPGALPFDVAARFWIVGGLGYVFLGAISCVAQRNTQDLAESQR